MALILSVLEQALLGPLVAKPPDVATAANKLAMAYDTYAKTAQAGTALPVMIGTEFQGLESSILPAMTAVVSGNPATMAAAWFQGVVAYWTASPAPVVFSDGVNTGVANPAGASVLTGCLTGAFGNIANTEQTAASLMAACLDAATRLVTVTLAPSGVTVPLA